MSGTRADARKARESQPLVVLREADRLNKRERVLRALQRVYPTAEWIEGDALRDALEDEELLA